jgi:uncharacterized membrane protein
MLDTNMGVQINPYFALQVSSDVQCHLLSHLSSLKKTIQEQLLNAKITFYMVLSSCFEYRYQAKKFNAVVHL